MSNFYCTFAVLITNTTNIQWLSINWGYDVSEGEGVFKRGGETL